MAAGTTRLAGFLDQQPDYFGAYRSSLKLTRDANGVLIAEFHSNRAIRSSVN
jgi:hypothetical protein